ncbi:MAG TPA: LLM class flavin-dependent oxidoreductase [Acidimicrobiales bacterium]|nr:LLM class flavin-dependent oxidoreductase [Acidimicrobiales bacterium]
MTPVGSGRTRPALGLILPATLQGELPDRPGATGGANLATAADVAELCRQAEATGADSLWAVDHVFWPHPIHECLTTLAIAASATRRPTLGSCVLQLPLRQPAVVAKQATALQQLSDGRFILGLGVGSHPGEYKQAGIDYHHRGRLMDEGIAAMQDAWATGTEPDTRYRQEPVSPRVPLWIGGASAAARRRAAAVGDAWVPLFVTADDYGPALDHLRQETVAAGRPIDAVEPAVVVFVHVGRDGEAHEDGAQWLSDLYGLPPKAFDRHLVAGSSEACAASLARFVEAGARHIVVMVAGAPAVQHFGFLRSAFVALSQTIPVGVAG